MMPTVVIGLVTVLLYVLDPELNAGVVRNVFGVAFLLELFYVGGSWVGGWPFPHPLSVTQIVVVVALGMALGVTFARFWPLPEETGFERIIRTFLIGAPAIGIGIGLQILLQGPQSRQALYLVFALSAWLGSVQITESTSGVEEPPEEGRKREEDDRPAEKPVRNRSSTDQGGSDENSETD